MQCELSVKQFLAAKLSCAELRPAFCPACDAASAPVGERVVVVGHGVRPRQVLGPLAQGLAPEAVVIDVRRYRCRACTAVCAVVPRGVLHGRWYGARAIALALGLMVLERKPTPAIHEEVSPFKGAGVSARRGWAQLSRWSRCAARLFAVPRPVRDGVAEVLSQLSSMCVPPAGTSPLERVLLGAMRIAPSRRPLPRPP